MVVKQPALVLALWAALGTVLLAQDQSRPSAPRHLAPGVETVVAPEIFVQEQRANPEIFGLEFAYKPPRFITVTVPDENGRLQRKRFWYLAYRVTNRTGQPRLFVPTLTLVTDTGQTYRDKVVPTAQKAVCEREDPALDWMNSATIVGLLPPTPEQAVDLSTYGVALWEGVDPQTDFFSIYVTGLSNGYQISQGPGGQQRVLNKTLELNFWRPGDARFENEKEIRPISQAPDTAIGTDREAPPDHRWIYR
jgi:hypothetical protein